MKIALDATPLYGRFGGIEGALWQTLLSLHALDLPHEMHVFVPHDAPPSPFDKPNWHWRSLPFEGEHKSRRIFWQQAELPRVLSRERFDCLHATNYVMPLLSPVRTVVFVPDLIALNHPRFATRANRLHYRAILPATLRRADTIFVPTPRGGEEVLRRSPNTRVVVTPLGVEGEFFERVTQEEREAVRHTFALPSRFLLYVGNLEPKKNLPRLLRAVEGLGPDAPELVLAGGIKPWPQLESLKLRTRFLGYVERHELRALMSECATFCFPSLAEGFGMPVVEALACGARVVASTQVPVPDLAKVAYTPNPHSVSAIADAIGQALSNSAFDASKAREFAHAFTWERTARTVAEVYETL